MYILHSEPNFSLYLYHLLYMLYFSRIIIFLLNLILRLLYFESLPLLSKLWNSASEYYLYISIYIDVFIFQFRYYYFKFLNISVFALLTDFV